MGSRMAKSMKNSVVGIIGMMCTLILSFVSKSIFIKLLGNEYNGVNYLFTGILNALNLAELGFASAIAFALYKPLSEGDEELTSEIMNFFKTVYRIVALIVAVLGACCIPILQFLIKEDMEALPFSLGQLRIYFSLFLLNTVLSYLLAYKRSLISADQRSYIISYVDYSANILLTVGQIVLLLITKSYYAFLGIMIAKTIINNAVIALIANKKYPYLKKYRKNKLLSEEKKKIFNNVKAMMLHKIGTVVIFNTTAVVISAFVGIVENGLYGNYMSIASQVGTLVGMIFSSVTASVGNLCVEKGKDAQYDIFNKMNYFSLWLFYFSFISYVCLFNHFIDIWLGKGLTFGIWTVIMISLNACVINLRRSVLTFRDAKGLFRADRYKPLIEAAVGIGLAIGLGHVWGVFGVMLGYTIATVFIAIPIETWVLFKKGFNRSASRFILTSLLTVAATAIVAVGMYYLTSLVTLGGVGGFVIKTVMCLIIPNVLFLLATFWTKDFKYYQNIAARMLKGITSKLRGRNAKIKIANVGNCDINAVNKDSDAAYDNGEALGVNNNAADIDSSYNAVTPDADNSEGKEL